MVTSLPIEGSVEELRARITGSVVTPDDPAFEDLRLAWNLAYEHHPSLITIPESAADVAAAIGYAVERHMPITVQTTGHGVARPADGGMLLLTHRLDAVTIDRDAWTARIGGGAKWAAVLGPATDVGLAPLLGSTPDVGAAGYTLGGGMGWLARKYGLAADHVRAIDIVTTDGRIRRASPASEPELFWALRGAGAGCFGVVTAIEIDLVSVSSLYAGNLLYPASAARQIAHRYREWISGAPDELTSAITFMNFPPVEDVPEPMRGMSFAIVRGAFIGTDEEGRRLLQFWRDWRSPVIDAWERMPFTDVAAISNDPIEPLAGMATTAFLDDINDDVIEVLARAIFETDGPSPLMMAEIRHAGGAIARAPEHESAYSNRTRRHVLELVGVVPEPAAMVNLEAFAADVKSALTPHLAPGIYLNFLEGKEKRNRTRAAFPPETWDRLRAVKARYDPADVFRHGLAIPPGIAAPANH